MLQLYLSHDLYDMIFKVKHKMRIAPPPPPHTHTHTQTHTTKMSGCAPGHSYDKTRWMYIEGNQLWFWKLYRNRSLLELFVNALGDCSHGNITVAERIFTPFTKWVHNCEVIFIFQAICHGLTATSGVRKYYETWNVRATHSIGTSGATYLGTERDIPQDWNSLIKYFLLQGAKVRIWGERFESLSFNKGSKRLPVGCAWKQE